MSHPDPAATPDLRPFRVGDVLENPMTRESARILELPDENPERRTKAELLAVVGSRVVGERLHRGVVERFIFIEGELTVRLDGVTSVLNEGETAELRPGQWHDWWNAADRGARVLVEITPGDRFGHETPRRYTTSRPTRR